MLKGWKTIIVAIAAILVGVLQMPELTTLTGGCIFDSSAIQPETCTMPSWSIALLGLIMLVLRFLTTSSVFKSDGK